MGERLPERIGQARFLFFEFRLFECCLLGCCLLGCCIVLACRGPATPQVDVSAEISAGELALARGNLDHAERHFELALGAGPGSERATAGLARTRVAEGELDAALLLFQKLDVAQIRAGAPGAFWDYCTALMGAANSRLLERRAHDALILARRATAEGCGAYRAHALELRSQLVLADEARIAGDRDGALTLYLEVLGRAALAFDLRAHSSFRGSAPPAEGSNPEDRARLRAYRGAAAILLASERREEVLNLLSGALLRFPDDEELVELMVEALTQPSEAGLNGPR